MLYEFKVTESKPAVRAMSPERRGCLLKKETQTSLYEVTTRHRAGSNLGPDVLFQMKFFTDYKKSSCVFENNVEILLMDFQ